MLLNYRHTVQYYETDAMGVVHHSNYLRWFEEARVALMEEMGFGYGRCEDEGILIPVLEVKCKYISPAKFGETVEIYPRVAKVTPLRLNLEYEIKSIKDKKLKATGESKHCFTNTDFRPVALDTLSEELYRLLNSLKAEDG